MEMYGARKICFLPGRQASRYYQKHIIQNWSREPFIRGSYSYDIKGDFEEIVGALSQPVSSQLYFAGEACSIENQSTVHGACETAYAAVELMVKD